MSSTPKLVNEPDLLVEGFHKLDSHLLESRAPKITFLPGFYGKTESAKVDYLVKLASTMNHAARLIQNERDALAELMVKKEQQLEQMARMMRANNEMLQSEVTRMNEKKQGYHEEVSRLNLKIRELENGDNGRLPN